ncbi:MAG: response regulator transcription factor [Anaerolineales bacterium]|nr:response regulator transcription factor [Anaerolineales bacterium]
MAISLPPIRILIIDDHAVVRKGLALVLRLEPDFEIVGEAGTGREALALAEHLKPDLILLDRMLPDMDGKAIAQALRTNGSRARILILTGTELDESALEILAVGIDGYVLKDIEPTELKRAIRTIATGEPYLDPGLTRLLMRSLSRPHLPPPQEIVTPRELDILQKMATPATYREIALQLSISEETVRSHAKNILRKLGKADRMQAVLEATRLGIIDPL